MNTPQRKAELLAPVGQIDSLWAAINNGADAVYLGASAFGARSSAGFDQEALQEAVRIAHFFHRRVYVTVNTLVKESEWNDLCRTLEVVASSGADAILVQDVGVLRYVKRAFHDLPVHASTQMSLYSAFGALAAKSFGIDRVVLAREASLKTIRETAQTGIETEVFVHGALCVSMSGQCAFSAMIGGRSGNRGRCAQACRLEYTYRGKKGAWLSPRDISMIERIPDLLKAGVASFKLEGRLKRPEYVAVVVQEYKDALQRAYVGQPLSSDASNSLKQIFNRGGFSAGYAFGAQDAEIINPLHVSHEGIPIGRVLNIRALADKYLASVQVTLPLHDQDGIEIRGAQLSGAIYSGKDIPAGGIVDIRLHVPCSIGDLVFRTDDAWQLDRARRTVTPDAAKPVDVCARLILNVNCPAQLIISDGETTATSEGEPVQPALKAPLDKATIERSVLKTGNLPVRVTDVQIEQDAPAFLASSQLNRLRRDALDAFIKKRSLSFHRLKAVNAYRVSDKAAATAHKVPPRITVQGPHIESAASFKAAGAQRFFWAPTEYDPAYIERLLPLLSKDDALVLPRQISDQTLSDIHCLVQKPKANVVLNNLGHTALAWPAELYAGSGLYVWNTESLRFMREQGFASCTLPRELTFNELEALDKDILPLILPVFGRFPLMVLNHCPERTFRGYTEGHEQCLLCKKGNGVSGQSLIDRRNVAFPLYPVHLPEGCINYLLDAKPLHLSNRAKAHFPWLINFTDESERECIDIIRHYAGLIGGDPTAELNIPPFVGRFEAGVE